MEMLQLRYFFESAINQSFAKTAKKHMVPTTSVSASVRRLEAELGCELFDRTGNSIVLNDKGRAFLESVRHIFSEIDNAVSYLNGNDDTENHKIKILAQNMRSNITSHIMEYREKHPQTTFSLNVDFDETDFDKYDIIVVRENAEKFSDYEGFIYRSYQIKVEAAEENPLCERKLTLNQLRNQTFVTTGINNEIYKIFSNACNREGFTPNFVFDCNDYNCIARCLRKGIGLGVTLSTEQSGASVGMRHLNIADFNEKFNVFVYYKKQKYHGAVKTFVDFLKTKVI